jgi:hypothetical protein
MVCVKQRGYLIDTSFDFRSDCPRTHDPDRWSPMLHRYHKVLWGRPLPSGDPFTLRDARPDGYLSHKTTTGARFELSSDAVMQTFTGWKRPHVRQIVERAPRHLRREFQTLAYTIGGMMVFPRNPIDGQWTINQARGFTGKIADRFDLTVECIRRHYEEQDSPLSAAIRRYADFFELFRTFEGYVEHFLLQDLVAPDGSVRFFLTFDDFQRSPLPRDVEEYESYREGSVSFIQARNRRIDELGMALEAAERVRSAAQGQDRTPREGETGPELAVEVVEELELVEVATGRVLGVASLLSDGNVLVDEGTHPYADVASIRGDDLWTHLRGIGNGYVMMRSMTSRG